MEPVAALGLLKLDFLGLVNLTVLAKARDLIAERHGISFDLVDIPLDDAKTFALLSRGDTAGVFQLEGGGMTRYIKELKPSALADVAAMIALYRPGPMEHISTFIDAKHGRIPVSYLHPALEEILEETYGVIVYQDQVLHIARTFAGYTLGEADIVRKAMGKKIPEIMAQEKEKFIEGALDQGFDQELADKVFALVEPFAGYAFNKAHSVSYGLISYWTAYLKANYTAEYMVSLLNSYVGHNDRINSAVAECQRLKIPVLPPSINDGRTEFTIDTQPDGSDAIRFGMGAVKGVGASALEAVIESRDKTGRFESIEHMCREANMSGVNRKTLESLVKVGALDDFGDRAALLESVDRIVSLAQSEASLKNSDQSSMFDMFGESVSAPLADISLPDITASDRERDEWERELLGMSLSNINILAALLTVSDSEHIVFRSDIHPDMAGKRVSLVGQIAGVTRRFTRQNKPFVIATLGLMDGQIEVFVWEDKLDTTEALWQEGNIVVIGGTVRVREDEISINCNDAGEYTPPADTSSDSSVVPNILPPTSNGSVAPTHTVNENGAAYTNDHPDVPEPVAAKAEANGSALPRSAETNGAASSHSDTNGHAKSTTGLAHSQVQVPHRLYLRIRESANAVDDQMMLDDVKRKLLDYEGKDEVMLEIASGGMIYRMEWSSIQVSVCDELTDNLSSILEGSGTVTVEAVRA